MQKILNWFTQGKMFLISIIFASLYPFSRYLIKTDSGLCLNIGQDERFAYWVTTCHFATVISFIAFGVALFSVLMLFFKKQSMFVFWQKFTFIYLFIYLFIVIITPWYEGDAFFAISKDLVGIFLTFLYAIISTLIILNGSLKKNS
ncbi:MAG: hypothetical protein M0P64_01710 [Candidatus Pacebacteria bacterium]|nr:hypothetical protein [Candidatus Paceibacterota bacterium]